MKIFFKLSEHNTNIKTELIGGITTFLTMAYIIFVNPSILKATGMNSGALITATCVAAFFGTLLVGLIGNVPFAMAPGMGLNAFFAYTLVLGKKVNCETALGIVFLSGLFFLILTIIGIREKIVKTIPKELQIATATGIGLFITFIGLKNMGLIVANKETLVTIGQFSSTTILGILGIFIIAILEIKKIKGSILIGILSITLIATILGLIKLPTQIISTPPSLSPIAFKLDIYSALKFGFIGTIFSFMFVDLFDSIGTIVACSYEANLVEKDEKIKKIDKILISDAIATIFGSIIGTSTTTTYIESASGIADGAKTGLSSIFTSLLFLLALFFTPLISIVPNYATAPALVVVGIFMFKNINIIDFKKLQIGIPAFLTLILMPLTYSISTGLSIGFISYTVINLLIKNSEHISITIWIITILSIINLAI